MAAALDDGDRAEMRRRRRIGETLREIAEKYETTVATARRITKGL